MRAQPVHPPPAYGPAFTSGRLHVTTNGAVYFNKWYVMIIFLCLTRTVSMHFDGRVASQFFLVSPRDHFVCPVPSFSEMKEIG